MQPDPLVVPHVPQNPLDKPGEPMVYEPINPWDAPQYFPTPTAPSGGKCQGNACLGSIEDAATNADKNLQQFQKQFDDFLKIMQPLIQVLDTSLLVTINNKLGPQLEGGISGKLLGLESLLNQVNLAARATLEKLGKVAKWLHLDRALNLLTFATTVHNATMLARGLGDTLMSVISNVLAAVGINDEEGRPLDIGNIIGNTVENLIKGMIGTENYTNLTAAWKRANRIYQASANVLFSVQSLRWSVTNILETIGGWNARIGNALRKWGVVGENSYGWMNPTPNFDNPFFRAVEQGEEVLSQIDNVASEVLSIQETVNQFNTQKTELVNSLSNGTDKGMTENQPQKQAQQQSKTVSASPDIESTDLQRPGGI
jgi:hypothetical protein